jgi:hypothetical protein
VVADELLEAGTGDEVVGGRARTFVLARRRIKGVTTAPYRHIAILDAHTGR